MRERKKYQNMVLQDTNNKRTTTTTTAVNEPDWGAVEKPYPNVYTD